MDQINATAPGRFISQKQEITVSHYRSLARPISIGADLTFYLICCLLFEKGNLSWR